MKTRFFACMCSVLFTTILVAQDFRLTPSGYFNRDGVDVMAFNDFYPEGHQGGVSVLMNGHRIASNGDIRMEATPGQWQPVPKQLDRKIEGGAIVTTLCFPDSSRHETGFNPMVYPNYVFNYTVRTEAQGSGIVVTVDLDKPIPQELLGKIGFNMEFFPGCLANLGLWTTKVVSIHSNLIPLYWFRNLTRISVVISIMGGVRKQILTS